MAAVWFVVIIPTQVSQQNKALKGSASQSTLSGKNNLPKQLEGDAGAKFEIDSETDSLLRKKGLVKQNHVEFEDSQSLKVPAAGSETGKSSRANSLLENNTTVGDSVEKVLQDTLHQLGIENAAWILSKDGNNHQVTFCVQSEDCEDVLQALTKVGIGSRPNTSLSVIPCTLHYDSKTAEDVFDSSDNDESCSEEAENNTAENKTLRSNKSTKGRTKFLQTVKSRLTVAQVVEGVRSSASLTFDFIMFVILAGLLAALGLVENSSVVLVASMLVSPMMGPILAGTFGTAIQDNALRKLGVRNELIGLSTCLSFGFLFGIIYGFSSNWHESFLLTDEMVARGQLRSLWVGVLIALPSGAGVALSVLGGNAGSLVGVAISASLLPPVVNAGLLWAIALTKLVVGDESSLMVPDSYKATYSNNTAIEASILGAVSLCLTIVNIICIFIMGVIMLKIKEVAPGTGLSHTRKFWSRDVPTTRDYNKTYGATDGSGLAERFLDEWVALSEGKSSAHRKSGGLDRLQRCMDDLEDDVVYRTVRQLTVYPAPSHRSHVTWHRSPTDHGSHGAGRVRSRYERSLSTPTPSDTNEIEMKKRRPLSNSGASAVIRATPGEKTPGRRTTWGFSKPKAGRHRFIVTKAEENRPEEA